MKLEPKLLIKRLIRRKENIFNGQWELQMKTSKLPKTFVLRYGHFWCRPQIHRDINGNTSLKVESPWWLTATFLTILIRLSFMKLEPKLLIKRLIRRKENIFNGQWELQMKTSKLPKTRENAGDQVVIGFSLAFDWLRVARVFWTNHRGKWSKTKFWIPFNWKLLYHTSLNLFTWTVWNEVLFF